MRLIDPSGALGERNLAALCVRSQRPLPERASLQAGRGPYAVYLLEWPDRAPESLWVALVAGVRGAALDLARAAHGLLELTDRVAPPAPFQIVPTDDGPKAAFRPWTGVPASAVLVERPELWPELADALAGAVAGLAESEVPAFASAATAGRFAPIRGSWREEWWAVVQASRSRAVSLGTDLGPLSDALLRAVAERLDALDAVDRFGLVHANLGPESVEIGADRLAVDAWEEAMLGDPLVTAAGLVGMSDAQLGSVLASLDPDLAASWRQPDAIRRIEAYHFGWCLDQLAKLGSFRALTGDLRWLARVDGVAGHARDALRPGYVASRLEGGARAGTGGWSSPPVDALAAELRVALGTLGSYPVQDRPMAVVDALGTLLLADRLISDPPRAKRALDLGWSTASIRRDAPAADREPLADPAGWRRQLAGLGLGAGGAAAALVWLAGMAIDRVRGDVPPEVLRGLERLVRGAAAAPVTEEGGRRLWVAALETAARVAGGVPVASDVLVELARDLDPGAPDAAPWTDQDAIAALDGEGPVPGRASLVLALLTLRGRVDLPGGPAWFTAKARP